jgi:MFS transporter, AAHS family, 4-hydroxybenzoate transporter
VFGLNLAEFYALQSWLPTILTNFGDSLNTVALATSLTTIGGIVAALVIGPAMDRLGPYGSLATVYFAGVAFVALLGLAVSAPSWVLLIAAFCAGFCISGGQKSVIALAAIFYPAPIRSTGVGWALGIGRLGGIGGPLLIGVLLAHQLSAASLFYAAAAAGRHFGHAAGHQIQDAVSEQLRLCSFSPRSALTPASARDRRHHLKEPPRRDPAQHR